MTTDNDIPTPKMGEGPGVEARPDADDQIQHQHTPEHAAERASEGEPVATTATASHCLGQRLAQPVKDRHPLTDWLRFLGHKDGELEELQALDVPERGTWRVTKSALARGKKEMFRLIRELYNLDKETSQALARGEMPALERPPQGCYMIGSRVAPELESRAEPGIWRTIGKGDGTTDSDVTHRRALFVDVDAARPIKKIPSTDGEMAKAHSVALRVIDIFQSTHIPPEALGLGHSGNGRGVYVALDHLPCSEGLTKTCKAILKCLSLMFTADKDGADIDVAVSEQKRLVPMPLTPKCKARNLPERPHRQVDFVCSESVVRVGQADLDRLLEHLLGMLRQEQRGDVLKLLPQVSAKPGRTAVSGREAGETDAFEQVNAVPMSDVARALGLDPENPVCPWCNQGCERSGQIAFAFGDTNRFKCQHGSCGGKSTNNVGLIAKVVLEVDDAKGMPKDKSRGVLDWARDHLGIDIRTGKRQRGRDTKDEPIDPTPLLDVLPKPLPEAERATALQPVVDAIATQPVLAWQGYIERIHVDHGLLKGDIRKAVEFASKRENDDDIEEGGDEADGRNAVLIDILRSLKLGRTTTGMPCGVVDGQLAFTGDRLFRAHVAALLYERTGSFLPADRLDQAANVVLGEGEASVIQAPIRFAEHEDAIMIDLVEKNRCIRIRPAQVDVIDSPISFLRPDGTLPLPVPVIPANAEECKTVLVEYRALFPGLSTDASWASAVAWLVSASRPSWFRGRRTGYVILRLKAEKGAGKTTQALYLSGIIDPRAVENDTLPDNTRDLAIIAEHTHVFVGDNVSHIVGDVQDALCKLALGMGFRTRALYTDSGLTTFVSSRPMIITSITDVADRDDLLDRSIRCDVVRPKRRVKDETLEKRFRQLHPRLLGAVAWLMAQAMARVDEVDVPSEIRMQSAAAWPIACEQKAALAEGAIVAAFKASEHEATDIVTSDPIACALVEVVSVGTSRTESAAAWYDLITDQVCGADVEGRRKKRPPRNWPPDARGLRKKLDRLAPALRSVGMRFTVESRPDHSKPQQWTWRNQPCESAVAISRYNQPSDSAKKPESCRPTADTADTADTSLTPAVWEKEENFIWDEDTLSSETPQDGAVQSAVWAVCAAPLETSRKERLNGTADSRLNPQTTDDNTPLTAEEAREALTAALRSAGLADAPGSPVPLSDVPDWLAPAPGIYAAEVLGIDEMTGTVDVSYVGRWGRARQRISGMTHRVSALLAASSKLHNGRVRIQVRQDGQHIVWPMEVSIDQVVN